MASDYAPRSGSSDSRNRTQGGTSSSRRSGASGSSRSSSGRSSSASRGSSGRTSSGRGGSASSSRPSRGRKDASTAKGARTSVGDKGRKRAQASSAKAARSSSRNADRTATVRGPVLVSSSDGRLDRGSERSAAQRASDLDRLARRDARNSRGSDRRSGEGADGERVGDIRRREREERAKRNRSRYVRYVVSCILVIVLVLGIIFGAIFLYRSDVLAVKNVNVSGISHLTSAEITEIAAVENDSTLLRLDSDGIMSRLEDNAWIQSASIKRVFPDTIEIDVVERTPGAVVRINDKSIWVISSDGTWLSAANDEDWDSLMRIIDVSDSLAQPSAGASCNDGGIENALEIIDGISDSLKDSIESISAESSIKTALNLEGGITVAFGDSSDIELKESVISEIIAEFDGKVSYINVRVPDRPTYRALDED